ncbi:unnamed protein product [Polarella glacialis]|uniref:PDZ domain-containing protein n=1 Tax=Polarella glacialis TaxID=89957 RepID=A0A813FVU7_POLGL|nr:unnamed protein product [Polarella glacialis]CAE8617737.1 unnamed protein product [Polarella glacialis]CAE8705750.1 unnamed protein product [Polarella glacialis]
MGQKCCSQQRSCELEEPAVVVQLESVGTVLLHETIKEDIFTVILDKGVVKKLGVNVDDAPDPRGLTVVEITGGLAEKWNSENPEQKIKVGDIICEVNGESQRAAMLDRCKEDDKLVVRVLRIG